MVGLQKPCVHQQPLLARVLEGGEAARTPLELACLHGIFGALASPGRAVLGFEGTQHQFEQCEGRVRTGTNPWTERETGRTVAPA